MVVLQNVKFLVRVVFMVIISIVLWPVRIKKNKILFINFNGKGYGDNPKSICEYLRVTYPELDLVWLAKDNEDFPDGVRVVRYKSLQSFYEQASSKVWVYNVRNFERLLKKRGQFYIQTWHGASSFKLIEKQADLPLKYILEAKYDARVTDIMISDSRKQTEEFQKYFWYSGEIFEVGMPRNDALFHYKEDYDKLNNIRKELSIDSDDYVILYAPTFRDDGDASYLDINFERLLQSIEQEIKKKCKILIRLHPNDSHFSNNISFNHDIIDVTLFSDMQELILLADVLLTDYSSAIFDFMLLNKPYVRYVNDLEKYGELRGLSDTYYELPDPIIKTAEELYDLLPKKIENFDYDSIKKYRNEILCPIFNGTASENVGRRIIQEL
ncbi:TPA: CDP-glycerol glycerophosphotransferase family protein [Streptococcus pneumoniae]